MILLLQVYIIISFTDANIQMRKESRPYDFLFVTLCGIYLLFHLSFLMVDIVKAICAKIRKSTLMKKNKIKQMKDEKNKKKKDLKKS